MARRVKLVFAAPRRIELVEEAVDGPPPGQALVRTLASAISAGTELLAFRGELPQDLALDDTLGALRGGTFAYPFCYGYASVGEVRAVGPGVDVALTGRRVFGFVPHATLFAAPVADLVVVPDGLDAERAALLAHMETAVNLILDGAPLYGERVLVVGAGTVGLLTIALLARFPLAALAVSEPAPLRIQAARALAGQELPAGGDEIRRALDKTAPIWSTSYPATPRRSTAPWPRRGTRPASSSAPGTGTSAPASTSGAGSTADACAS
jgi:2-desacetyl-2-hydroxyethyl bacteriochlorophyllide A dehydrogenase